jgi:hypothetical protein
MTEPSSQQVFDAIPLAAFSLYTHVQAQYLLTVGAELSRTFDRFCGEIDGDKILRAYGQFWLWVLGAYEVVRTLDQNRARLAPAFAKQVTDLKRTLAEIRIPLAKQERRGSGKPIAADLSIVGIDHDLLFQIDGVDISARAEIQRFAAFVSQVRLSDFSGRAP